MRQRQRQTDKQAEEEMAQKRPRKKEISENSFNNVYVYLPTSIENSL